jgi:hypothetical protein
MAKTACLDIWLWSITLRKSDKQLGFFLLMLNFNLVWSLGPSAEVQSKTITSYKFYLIIEYCIYTNMEYFSPQSP